MIAAGLFLRQNAQAWELDHQKILQGNPQQVAEGHQIVRAGQRFSLLPFVDGLGSVESEVFLHFCHRQPLRLPETDDVLPGRDHVDDRVRFDNYKIILL